MCGRDRILALHLSLHPPPFPVLPPFRERPPVPEIGVLRIPQHDFAQDFSDFSFQSHLTKLEVISAIQKIMTENQKVLKVSLAAQCNVM